MTCVYSWCAVDLMLPGKIGSTSSQVPLVLAVSDQNKIGLRFGRERREKRRERNCVTHHSHMREERERRAKIEKREERSDRNFVTDHSHKRNISLPTIVGVRGGNASINVRYEPPTRARGSATGAG